jgi:hypothetical protein
MKFAHPQRFTGNRGYGAPGIDGGVRWENLGLLRVDVSGQLPLGSWDDATR